MSRNLVRHAKDELERARMFDKDADYYGAIATSVMELMEVFAIQGHSGMSAMLTVAVFTKLARGETLTPVTSDPDEWMDVSEMSGRPMWQNRRNSAFFSTDGGTSWYDVRQLGAAADSL